MVRASHKLNKIAFNLESAKGSQPDLGQSPRKTHSDLKPDRPLQTRLVVMDDLVSYGGGPSPLPQLGRENPARQWYFGVSRVEE